LTEELSTARLSLLTAYESRDKLLYVEAPALRNQYMEKIGSIEEAVLEAELDVSLLQRKIELIQIAKNRREVIDEQAIDEQLAAEKEGRLTELEETDRTLKQLPELTEEQKIQLQEQYKSITSDFHPALNHNLTATQKHLYERAIETYKNQDVDAMQLIYDMLYGSDGTDISFKMSISNEDATLEERRRDYKHLADAIAADFSLAKLLYANFTKLQEDAVVLTEIQNYVRERESVEKEIESIRKEFPFNAVDTINNPQKTEQYLTELRTRAQRCEEEKAELEEKIQSMLEVESNE